jgi:hypothetical protein
MSLLSGIGFATTSACSSPKASREAGVAAISRAACATHGTATYCATVGGPGGCRPGFCRDDRNLWRTGIRALAKELDPTVAFVNEGEWDVVGGSPGTLSVDAVIKSARLWSTFVVGGARMVLGAVPCPVVDVSGAGDALAAGYFVGGRGSLCRAHGRAATVMTPPQAGRGWPGLEPDTAWWNP